MKLLTEGSNSCEDFEWEDLDNIELKGNLFRVEVKNFGWRRVSGMLFCNVDRMTRLLSKILPNTECSFKIFKDGKNLKIQNYHHDSPCGDEWYTVYPISQRAYEKGTSPD